MLYVVKECKPLHYIKEYEQSKSFIMKSIIVLAKELLKEMSSGAALALRS